MDGEPELDRGQPSSEIVEVARIRAVYKRRDQRASRSRPIQVANGYLAEERRESTRRVLGRHIPDPHPRILDVGCGTGGDLAYWQRAGWPADQLSGIDVVPERLAAARLACPGADLRLNEGSSIPFPDASADVVSAATVFSSILDADVRRALFAEMERVVRPGGVILIYDFVIRKPTNPNVLGMPLRRLAELGRPPSGSIRLSPLLQLVAVAAALHPRLADVAMRLAPRTHRLTYWRASPAAPASR